MPRQAYRGAPILAGPRFCCAPGALACRGPCTQAGLRVHVECTLCRRVFLRVGGVGLQSGAGGLVFERAVLGAASEFYEAGLCGCVADKHRCSKCRRLLWRRSALRASKPCTHMHPHRVSTSVGRALPPSGAVRAPA